MTAYRPRIWFGLGISVLAVGLDAPARAADPACQASAAAPLGEAGESGEGGAVTPASRALLLDRMAAQIEGAAAARDAGDAESADILVGAATDEGPARLSSRTGFSDLALNAALVPLAAAPADAAARDVAMRAVEAVLASERVTPTERAAGLATEALDAFAAAQDCGRLSDRAAYVEAGALVRRALGLVRAVAGAPAQEMAGALEKLAALLPAAPPATLPAMGAVSALVSGAVLAASDAAR